ncbi:hypothetical protein SEEACDC1_17265, partial [Salmonella enterica subsp. enterica serovar Agona str. SA-1]
APNLPSGLSPLARGTPLLHRYAQTTQRFIPAGAGEHVNASAINKKMTGLSPLARGTQLRQGHVPAGARFIPAGAGNTL